MSRKPPPVALQSSPPSAPAAVKPSRALRTRERILKTSLDLFNTYGEAQVTTGHIADELNISPGNLYYHFRNKEEIIQHLFKEFEQRIDVAPQLEKQAEEGIADVGAAMEDLWLYLHLVFEAIWNFRFLYRNLDDLLSRDAKLKSHFNRIIDHKRKSVIVLCEGLVGAGAMKAGPEEMKALAENILVVATYWLNFQHISQRQVFRADLGETEDLGRGVFQVMALVAPYMVGPAREHLDHLSKNYID